MNLILFTYIKKWCEKHIHFVQIWTCQIQVTMIIGTGLCRLGIRSFLVTKTITPWSSTMKIINGHMVNNYVPEWPKLTNMHGNDENFGSFWSSFVVVDSCNVVYAYTFQRNMVMTRSGMMMSRTSSMIHMLPFVLQ